MSALSIQPTYPIFTDIDGQPLEDGFVWIGQANLDPQVNPINVFWDAALTIPAGQPIRTLGGYPANSGTPARLYVNSDYSIRVMNKNGSVVYSAQAATERYSDVVVNGINAEDVIYDPPFTGAVQTNVEAKLAQTVSVNDFGAVGDGVTDDTAAIQAAIDASEVVEFPKATYAITSTITIPSDRLLLGKTAIIKRKTGSIAFDMFQNSDQVGGNANIKVRDLFINGNAVADGFSPVNPADRFSGISFINVTGNSEITGCTVVETINNETGAGIYVYDCSDVLVQNNIGYDNDRTFIYYRNGARNKFIRNICYDNAGSGISGKDCESAEFEGNQTYNNGSAGNFSGLNASCLRARVIGNLSYSNTGAGIAIGETSSADGSDAKVIGNICRLNTLEGIYIENSARVSVIGNQVHDNVRNNIRVRTQAIYCTIMGNTVNGGSGVGASGITLDGGIGHKVIGNTVSGAYSSGIYIGATALNAVVSENTCFDNCVTSAANAGIFLQSATGCIISNNRCYDSAGAGGTQTTGIQMVGGSSNTVTNNDVSGNKTNGILNVSNPIYSRRLNKIGTDPISGNFFTVSAGASYLVVNNSAQSTSRITVWGVNAAGAALPVYVSAVTPGVDFTITPSTGSFAGTENYAYSIE